MASSSLLSSSTRRRRGLFVSLQRQVQHHFNLSEPRESIGTRTHRLDDTRGQQRIVCEEILNTIVQEISVDIILESLISVSAEWVSDSCHFGAVPLQVNDSFERLQNDSAESISSIENDALPSPVHMMSGCVPKAFAESLQPERRSVLSNPSQPPSSTIDGQVLSRIDGQVLSRIEDIEGQVGENASSMGPQINDEIQPCLYIEDSSTANSEVQTVRMTPRRIVQIEDLSTEPEPFYLPAGQREVRLNIGNGLGIVFSINEDEVFIKDLVLVRSLLNPSELVVGSALASNEVHIGDEVLEINGKVISNMDFDEIVLLIKNLEISGREEVIFLLRGAVDGVDITKRAAFLDDVDAQRQINPASLLMTTEEQSDPFAFADGVMSHASLIISRNKGAFLFPGDLGLHLDQCEMDRRIAFLMKESRRIRGIMCEGHNFGFFDDYRASPLLRHNSTKILSDDIDGECRIRFIHSECFIQKVEPAERSIETNIGEVGNYLTKWWDLRRLKLTDSKKGFEIGDRGDFFSLQNNAEQRINVLSGNSQDEYRIKFAKPASSGPQQLSEVIRCVRTKMITNPRLELMSSKWWDLSQLKLPGSTMEFDIGHGDAIYSLVQDAVVPTFQIKSEPCLLANVSESLVLEALDISSTHVTSPFIVDVTSASEFSIFDVCSELQIQLFRVDIYMHAGVVEELTDLEGLLQRHKHSDGIEQAAQLVLMILNMTVKGVREGYLGDRSNSPLKCWPPPKITEALKQCIHLNLCNGDMISDVISTCLKIWIECLGKTNIWRKAEREASVSKGGCAVLENDVHRFLVCELITLFILNEIMGLQLLTATVDRRPFNFTAGFPPIWKFRLIPSSFFLDSKTSWPEKKAVEFVEAFSDFVWIDSIIEAAGMREWVQLTNFMLKTCTLSGMPNRLPIRFAIETIAHAIDSNSEREESSLLIKNAVSRIQKLDGYLAVLLECGQFIWRYRPKLASQLFAEAFPRLIPWHVWRIVASMFGPLTFSIADIGTRVAVWWAGNNSYYYGIVIAFREASGRAGLHTVKFDDGDVIEYDLNEVDFEIVDAHDVPHRRFRKLPYFMEPFESKDARFDLGAQRRHRPLVEGSSHMLGVWWTARSLFFEYLGLVLDYQLVVFGNGADVPSYVVVEFVWLSLLLVAGDSSVTRESQTFTAEKCVMYHSAFAGDEFDDFALDSDRLRQASGIGLSAAQERIRNSVISSKGASFILGGHSLDVWAWFYRGLMGSDYDIDMNAAEPYVKFLGYWHKYSADDIRSNRYTDSFDNIDKVKLETTLQLFLEMSAELQEAPGTQMQSTVANISSQSALAGNGYKSAWGKSHEALTADPIEWSATIHRRLTDIWMSLRRTAHADIKGRGDLKAVDDIISRTSHFVLDELQLALICARFGYWKGVVTACQRWTESLHVEASKSNAECRTILGFELLRGTAIDAYESSSKYQTEHALELLFEILSRVFCCVDTLADIFTTSEGLMKRSWLSRSEEVESLDLGVRLICGMIIDMTGFCDTRNISQVQQAQLRRIVARSLILSLGVKRSLKVLEMATEFEVGGISGLDLLELAESHHEKYRSSLISDEKSFSALQANLESLQIKKNITASSVGADKVMSTHELLNKLQSNQQSVGWGAVVDVEEKCTFCVTKLCDDEPNRLVAFQCGHQYHEGCAELFIDGGCFLCIK